jgi:hypothetical protein
LRESPVSSKYIEVDIEKSFYSECNSSYSDDEHNEFIHKIHKSPSNIENHKPVHVVRSPSVTECHRPNYKTSNSDLPEYQASIEGPINPINYSGI